MLPDKVMKAGGPRTSPVEMAPLKPSKGLPQARQARRACAARPSFPTCGPLRTFASAVPHTSQPGMALGPRLSPVEMVPPKPSKAWPQVRHAKRACAASPSFPVCGPRRISATAVPHTPQQGMALGLRLSPVEMVLLKPSKALPQARHADAVGALTPQAQRTGGRQKLEAPRPLHLPQERPAEGQWPPEGGHTPTKPRGVGTRVFMLNATPPLAT